MRLGYLMPLTVENIATARRLGYSALEANVGWLDGLRMAELESQIGAIQEALAEHDIAITAVAIYGNAIETPVDEVIAYYRRAMALARQLDCFVIAGMTGRDNALTVAENIPLFKARFEPIAKMAGDSGMRLALEPWPGRVTGYGPYRWANLAISPEMYDRLFDAVPHPALGIEYDASHYYWQGIDHLQLWRDYAGRIYHVHAKDIVVDRERLKRVGVHGPDWWRFVIPGLGEINWAELIGLMRETGYTGDIAVEHEDRVYLGERWNEGLTIALKTLRPLVLGDA